MKEKEMYSYRDSSEKKDEFQRILVCDSEEQYGERLVEYLNGHLNFPCSVERYTSIEKLEALGQEEKSALMIVSEREYRKTQSSEHKEKLLVLNETGTYLGDTVVNVSKYQSMDIILSLVKELTLQEADSISGIRHGKSMQLIGCYTPLTRCLQTTLALTFGQFLARKHRVLYLNFENYSGLGALVPYVSRGSISDLLYYNECAREKLTAQMGLLTGKLNGLDYIPPMKSFLELRAIQCSQWLDLFHTLEQVTEYEYVILDLSESVDGLLDILRVCEQIFTIVRDDELSRAKLSCYEDMLRSSQFEDIAARTKRWRFPLFRELPAALDNLTHGEMAELVHRVMEEEGYHVDG